MPAENLEPDDRPPERQGITAHNLVLGFGIRGGSLLLGAVTAAVVARVLDPRGVAQALVALSVGTTIGVVCQAGLPFAVAYRVARVRVGDCDVSLLRQDLRSACLYLGGLGFIIMAASIPSWGFDPTRLIPEGSLALFVAAAVIGVGRAASRILSETSKGFGDVNAAGVGADLVGPTVGLVGVAVLALTSAGGATSAEVVLVMALGWCVATAFALWRAPVRPALRSQPAAASGDRLRNVMGALGIIAILSVGIQQAHIIISGLLLPVTSAAAFSTAARLATLTGAPLMLLGAVASPDIGVSLQSGERERIGELERRLQRVTGLLLLPGILMVAAFVIAGAQILALLFGSSYAVGYPELVVLSLGPLASLAAGVVGNCLLQAGRRRAVLADTVVGSAVALAGMLLGGIYAGALGLALGYSLGQTVINLLLLRSCRRELGITPYAKPLVGLRWLVSVVRGWRRLARN